MTTTTTRENNSVRIVLQGEIDECGAEELKARFREVSMSAPQQVAVDFSAVSHIGSAGIGKLLVFYKDLAIHGAQMSLVRVPSPIFRMLREMRLETIFPIEELATEPVGAGASPHRRTP